ncbi:PD-(D/E)XK motif protein [Lysinibacillus antri]|uniref:PD-(D/E)XK motif protein n=1 Tax=Lysinibacillus antri TaxID=2498145 RepID=A0A432LDT1_9BACI|nr:PD-(D/E)XK motif protein [Lysinibacillus antri]RUL53948.1 PD-(D/E)XK motif protein [Lysinibacillus antri]
MINNPWENINYGSRRRAIAHLDIFWIKESTGDYGVCIEVPTKEQIQLDSIALKDIEVIKSLNAQQEKFEWYLILRNKEEWEIFLVLCEDLIKSAISIENELSMLAVTEIRLKRWQNLLKKKLSNKLPLEVQMGLYTELLFLYNQVIPKIGPTHAINSWVGPDYDKQDFLLDDRTVEIKSYKTTKGEKVTISSKEQLNSPKDALYLVAYALTNGKNGENIAQLVNKISAVLISNAQYSTLELFELKLMDFGYSPIIHKEEDLFMFIVDKISSYKVKEDFPKLTNMEIPLGIVALKYQIDLTKCSNYEVAFESILDGVS